MTTKYPRCTQYSLQQIRNFCAQAKDRVGEKGWRYLSVEMREALVAKQVMEVMFSNARLENDIPFKISWFLELHKAMRKELGLEMEGEE